MNRLFFYKRPETTKEKLIAEMECKKGKENFRKIIEMVSEKTKLKPCPFCNGKAILEESKFGFNTVYCESCGAKTTAWYLPDAIETWNRRATTCKKNLQLTRSDIEEMVKLEWRDNRPMVADCGDFNLNIFYMRENEYTIYASKGILGGEMYIGTTKSEEEAKQKAKEWLVDLICSALGVEE